MKIFFPEHIFSQNTCRFQHIQIGKMKIEHESRFEIDFDLRLIFLLVVEELLVEKDLFRDAWTNDTHRTSKLGFMIPDLSVVRQLQSF